MVNGALTPLQARSYMSNPRRARSPIERGGTDRAAIGEDCQEHCRATGHHRRSGGQPVVASPKAAKKSRGAVKLGKTLDGARRSVSSRSDYDVPVPGGQGRGDGVRDQTSVRGPCVWTRVAVPQLLPLIGELKCTC